MRSKLQLNYAPNRPVPGTFKAAPSSKAFIFFKTNREVSIRVMQKFMAGLPIEIVNPLYNETKDRLPTLPMPMKQAIQSALDREPDPKAKALQPSDVADIGFLQEIEKSGFCGNSTNP